MTEGRIERLGFGRKFLLSVVILTLILSLVGYVPSKVEAPISNSAIYADWANNVGGYGPGIRHFWYPDWWPATVNNAPHDLMWYGSYDYIGTAAAGTGTMSYWETPDTPPNGVPPGPGMPGAGKWADDYLNTPLDNGAITQIDAQTLQVTFTGSRATGASFNIMQTFYVMLGQRTIKITVDVTNTAGSAYDFAYYHAEDLCAGDWQDDGYGFNDLNGDGNDAANNAPPFDMQNRANSGTGDPNDLWDERILKYTSPNWPADGGGWNNPANPNRETTSGWKGPGLGYVTVLDASGKDSYTQNWGVPATPGADGLPDDFASMISFESDIDWYVGRFDATIWGPGWVQLAASGPPPVYIHYSWEDVFEAVCDIMGNCFLDVQYQDSPGHSLEDTDNSVGLLKNLGTINSGETKTFVYYIGEPPHGKDLVVTSGDIAIAPDPLIAYEGTSQTITANIWNYGMVNVETDFNVDFYTCVNSGTVDPDADDDGSIDPTYLAPAGCGTLLGTVTITNSPLDPLTPFSSKSAILPWNSIGPAGLHDIWVVVDYPADGNVDEINTPDNEWRNNRARYLLPGTFYEVLGDIPAPKNLTADVVGANIVLTWEPVVASILDHYIIYCSNSQIDFDFKSICDTTTTIPWTDPSAIVDGETYYIVRAANANESMISSTSNTAGKWTAALPVGLSTLSKPLEYFGSSTPMTVHDLTLQLGANSISWQDALSDNWFVHEASDGPGVDDTTIVVGDGFVVDLPAQTQITFTGLPAAMIKYDNSSPGFDPLTDAKSISAQVMGNDIDLTWSSLGAGIEYYVYWSDLRDGFFTGSYSILNAGSPVAGTSYSDVGAASTAGENYYLIVPYYTATGAIGSSTYSIGVWTAEYNGNDFFALPLKPMSGYQSADWYADQISNCLGIVYLENGIWNAHFKEFPAGVYDTTIAYGRGYDLTVYASTKYSHIGW